MWTFEWTADYEKRSKAYRKKWRHELDAVLNNLQKFHVALNEGAHPLQTDFTFVRNERKGLLAIDESQNPGILRATRLYIYPELETKILHVITIGDKSNRQSDDIQKCHDFIAVRKAINDDNKNSEDGDGPCAPDFREG